MMKVSLQAAIIISLKADMSERYILKQYVHITMSQYVAMGASARKNRKQYCLFMTLETFKG